MATIGGGETRGGVDAGSGRSYGESGRGGELWGGVDAGQMGSMDP